MKAFSKEPPIVCRIPPLGWSCSRTPGHEGPCATYPSIPLWDELLDQYDDCEITRADLCAQLCALTRVPSGPGSVVLTETAHAVIDRRDQGIIQEAAFLLEHADAGWSLVAVIVLPITFSRMENDWLRYYLRKRVVLL